MNGRSAILSQMPACSNAVTDVIENASTDDIVRLVLEKDEYVRDYMANVAPSMLVPGDLDATCRNIYNLVRDNVEYREDQPGTQDLKSPSCLFTLGAGDCKSFALSISGILQNLGIEHCYRFISQDAGVDVHHVYVAVPVGNNRFITIDPTPVATGYNKECNRAYADDYYRSAGNGKNTDARSSVGGAVGSAFGAKLKLFFTGGILNTIKDVVVRKKMEKVLEANLEKAALYFTYLFYPDSKYAKDHVRFPVAMEKTLKALDIWVEFAQSFEKNAGFSPELEYKPARALYRAGKLDEWRVAYNAMYAKMKTSELYPMILEATTANLTVHPVRVIDSYLQKALAEEWAIWTEKPTIGYGSEYINVPFTAAEQTLAMTAPRKAGAPLPTGWLGVRLTVPSNYTAQQFASQFYTEKVAKKLNVGAGSSPVYFAYGPELGANYTMQAYTTPYNQVRPPVIAADNKTIVVTLSKYNTNASNVVASSFVSKQSPQYNKDVAALFAGFGYQNKYTPGPVYVGGRVGEVVSIIIGIASAVAAIIAIVAELAKVLKKNPLTPGMPTDPVIDYSRCYEINGGTACPQPDGRIEIFDANGAYADTLPPGATPPPPYEGGIFSRIPLWGWLLGVGLTFYVVSKN